MQLTVATWIAAIATVILALGAIVTSIFAIRAFGKQPEEVRLLKEQTARDIEQRRRAQASRVSVWQEPLPVDRDPESAKIYMGTAIRRGRAVPIALAQVTNSSDQPVYDLTVSWYAGHALNTRHRRPEPLMPGERHKVTESVPADANPEVFGAVAFFRDAAGVTWQARPDGRLAEIPIGQEPPGTL